MLAAVHCVLFAGQWMIIRGIWFYPAWDPYVVWHTAQQLAEGVAFPHLDYFSFIPHNVVLPMLLSIPYRLGMKLGLAEPHVMLLLCSAASINLTCFLTTLCLRRLTGSWRVTLWGAGLLTVFILLSPFSAIAYSDAFSILFPVLALLIYLSALRTPIKWFWGTVVSGVGATIKPTVFIFWIAVVL